MIRMNRVAAAVIASCLGSGMLVAPAQAAEKVLMVVSSEGRDQGKSRPGFEFDEYSQAYWIFRDNGLEVEVASPAGGAVEPDAYNPEVAYNARTRADAEAMRLLANTLDTEDAAPADYAAVFVVGGKGAMLDLPGDAALQSLMASIYERGGVVSAVCHGPAALVNVRLSDGSALVAGKSITGFSNEEEALFGKRWVKEFAFLLEDGMRQKKARWSEAPLMMPHWVADGRVITGQNPYSTTGTAEAVVRALGRAPVARTPYQDERTMSLVQQFLDDSIDAASALRESREQYQVELIGMLGYYQWKAATNPDAVRAALSVMTLAEPYMDAPQLKLAMAEANQSLGQVDEARRLLQVLLDADPAMAEAKRLMSQIDG